MTSVVIAAYNEGRVIGRCLDALLADPTDDPLEVVVAANGCHDDTVDRARRPGVVVLDLPQAGKPAALNAAEAQVTSFPRVYLDADMRLSPRDVERLTAALDDHGASEGTPLAAAPRREVDTRGSGFLVRQYYRALALHPAYRHSLFGRGVVVLSERGRRRFGEFPEVLADDFFLDSLFGPDEKVVVPDVVSVVEAPSSTGVLLRRLARVRRGNRELRRSPPAGAAARPAEGLGWLTEAVRRDPRLLPAAVTYVLVTLYADLVARWGGSSWGHDPSRPSPTRLREAT
jgi:glycosyltransferase involved in cell wall biosynthesis